MSLGNIFCTSVAATTFRSGSAAVSIYPLFVNRMQALLHVSDLNVVILSVDSGFVERSCAGGDCNRYRFLRSKPLEAFFILSIILFVHTFHTLKPFPPSTFPSLKTSFEAFKAALFHC